LDPEHNKPKLALTYQQPSLQGSRIVISTGDKIPTTRNRNGEACKDEPFLCSFHKYVRLVLSQQYLQQADDAPQLHKDCYLTDFLNNVPQLQTRTFLALK
jgi:hypothetical protein